MGNDMKSQEGKEAQNFSSRQKAKLTLQGRPIDLQNWTSEDIQNLIQELQVHQVELELQNQQLRLAQQDLEAMRNKFVYLYDFAPVGYITIDEQGRIWEANLTAVSQLGLERAKLIKHLLSGCVAPEDQDIYYLWRRSLFTGSGGQSCELRLIRGDGLLFYAHLEGRVAREIESEANLARVVITDVNVLKETEKSLREEQRLLRTLIDNLPDYIYVKDNQSRFVTGNSAVAEVMGAESVEDLVGKSDLDFYAAALAAQFRADEVTIFESGRPLINKEERLINSEGEARIITTTKIPLRDQRGQVIGLVGIGRDITEQKRVENEKAQLFTAIARQKEEMRALATRLAEAQESERQQLARELHDKIGQNLTALGFNLNFIGMQLVKPEPKLELLQARLRDSLSLVEQTTDRIRDVMAELRPPMLDDYGLVDALEWYGQRFEQRTEVVVTVQGGPKFPRLEPGTENALFRIAQEALNNVAKHAQASEVMISLFEDNQKVRLVILDNGIGFEPARRSQEAGELRLGLLTMVERAEAVGGVCRIESQPGRGARVLVEVRL